MLRRTLLSSLLQTALLGAAGGIGFAPGKAAARNNARSAPVEECEADLVIVGSGAAGLSAGLAALEAGVRKVVILEKAAIAGGHTMLASGSVSAVFGADVDKLIDAMLTAGAGENNPALVETLARQSGAAFEWLAEHGVNWMKTPYRAVGSPGAWSYSTGSAQAGYDYVQCLNRAYHRLGGRIHALRSLKAELRPFVVIRPPFSLTADDASKRRLIMRGDPLEIELLLLNVMKNAAEAVQGLPDGAVLVKFRRETLPSPLAENPSPSPAAPSAEAVIVEVEDNGPRLSDEAFERLTRVSQSVKDEGLGLGLGIVRSLVEENGGRIAITRREDLSGRGLRVTLCFDLDAEGLKAQSAPHTDPADKSAAQAFQRSHEPAAKTAK